jgi:predicted nucleotidyltransferase
MNSEIKKNIKRQVLESLASESEIRKIIIFGSFIHSVNPRDIDIAIIQDSNQSYLTLALKYRKLMRDLSKKIPLDVIPIKFEHSTHWFLNEINSGELIYERRN